MQEWLWNSQVFLESCLWQKLKDQCSDHIASSIENFFDMLFHSCYVSLLSVWVLPLPDNNLLIHSTILINLCLDKVCMYNWQMKQHNILQFSPKSWKVIREKPQNFEMGGWSFFHSKGGESHMGGLAKKGCEGRGIQLQKIELYTSFFYFLNLARLYKLIVISYVFNIM